MEREERVGTGVCNVSERRGVEEEGETGEGGIERDGSAWVLGGAERERAGVNSTEDGRGGERCLVG